MDRPTKLAVSACIEAIISAPVNLVKACMKCLYPLRMASPCNLKYLDEDPTRHVSSQVCHRFVSLLPIIQYNGKSLST